MRIFYVFKINDEIAKMTKNKPENIYDSLEQIYLMDKNKTIEGKNLLESISNRFNKENINSLLKDIYRDNIYYNCYNNVHTYNDFLKDEQTKIYVYNTHIKIKSNVNNPIFLNDIKNIKNLFVCDFINIDYFWLKNMLSLV